MNSNAYMLVLFITVICILCITVYLTIEKKEAIKGQIVLSSDGVIHVNQNTGLYQLNSSSRFSFIGIWLRMSRVKPVLSSAQVFSEKKLSQCKRKKVTSKQVFIFKDSLTQQDFSRIANVIKKLP